MSDETETRVTKEDLDALFDKITHGDDAYVSAVRLLTIKHILTAPRFILAFLCRNMFAALQEAKDAYETRTAGTENKT